MLSGYAVALVSALFSRWNLLPLSGPEPGAHLAIKLGLGPESCAAAGMSSQTAGMFLQNLQEATTEQQALRSAEGSLDAATRDLVGVLEALEEDSGNPELLSSRIALTASLAQARIQTASARHALLAAGLSGLGQDQSARAVRSTQCCTSGLPAAIRIADLSPSQSRRAAAALTAFRRAQLTGKEPPAAASSLLSTIEGRGDVSDAVAKIAENKAAIAAVFATSCESH